MPQSGYLISANLTAITCKIIVVVRVRDNACQGPGMSLAFSESSHPRVTEEQKEWLVVMLEQEVLELEK